jgi:hypothetical protein
MNKLIDELNIYNLNLSKNIINEIYFHMIYNNLYSHVSFLINNKTNKLLSYGINYQNVNKNNKLKTIHSEIDCINKYLKNKRRRIYNTEDIKSNKTIINIRLSKTGVLGTSTPCKSCYNTISNYITDLNIIYIDYTDEFSINKKINFFKLKDNTKYSNGRKNNKNNY